MEFSTMKKFISFALIVLITFSFGSCSLDVITMPNDAVEYRSGDWTADQLTAHFKELGFSDIKVTSVGNYYGEVERVEISNVTIEDSSSDSWITQYKTFKKGESYASWLKIKIETKTYGPQYGSALSTQTTESSETAPPVFDETTDTGRDYIVNTSTNKFHRPSCSSADDIKESNRWEYHGTRGDLIEEGYEPCKRCKP